MRTRSIQNTILLWAGLCLTVAVGCVVMHASFTVRGLSRQKEYEKVRAEAGLIANLFSQQISHALTTARTFASCLAGAGHGNGLDRKTVGRMLETELANNPEFVGVYCAFEPDAFDGQDAKCVGTPGHDSTGRFVPYWSRDAAGRIIVEPLVDYESAVVDPATGTRKGDYYLLPREKKTEVVVEPYIYPVQGRQILMTSLVAPVMTEGRFIGISGVDLPLDFLQRRVQRRVEEEKSAKKSRTRTLYVLSAGRKITAASDHPELAGKSAEQGCGRGWDQALAQIGSGDEDPVVVDGVVSVAARIELGESLPAWSMVWQYPESEALAAARDMVGKELLLGLVLAACALMGLWWIARAIADPIGRTVEVAQRIAQGDLNGAKAAIPALVAPRAAGPGRVQSSELVQLADAVSRMTSSLSSLIEKVDQASGRLASVAGDISSVSRTQEASAGEFETQTARIVTATNEITATARELAKGMGAVQEVSRGTVQLADTGRAGLADMQRAMDQLAGATASIGAKLSVISEKATTITGVVTAIAKVADQTNLLSLNAAIEAEKAGASGLGFSVVAREIRRLADQTAAATVEIGQTVKEMQSSVSAGVMEMDRFSEEMRRGVEDVNGVSGQLGKIIEQVRELALEFERVNEGMSAQTQGAGQIREAMIVLNTGAKKTAESARRSSEVGELLEQAVRTLQAEIERFKL